MIIDDFSNPKRKLTVSEASAANDYFTRRKSEEDRIAGVKAPAKNKKNPANTDYAKKRKQQDIEESRPFRGTGGAFNRGDDERHDLDPSDWYKVKDGKMFAASIYPRQVQQAIAQGFSRTKQEARARAGSEGAAEGSEQQWTVTVGTKTGGTSHTMTFSGTKEQAIKKAVARFGTSKNPVVNAVPAKQSVAEGSLEENKGMTGYNAFKREWRAKHGADAKVPAYDSKEYTSYVYRQNDKKQGVAEGSLEEVSQDTARRFGNDYRDEMDEAEEPMQSPEQIAYNQLRAQWDGYQAMTSGGGNTYVSRDPAHAAKLATIPAQLAKMSAALKAKGINAEADYNAIGGPKAAPVDINQQYVDEVRMSAAQRLSNAWDKQRAKSDASLRRTPSSIPKKEEPKKADPVPKTVSEHRAQRRALMAQMLNSH